MGSTCQQCGEQFECGISLGNKACWCLEMPIVSGVPKEYESCICKTCLSSYIKDDHQSSKELESKNEDYYIDDSGYYVFTEKYHLDRGYCCKNSCRHCPY